VDGRCSYILILTYWALIALSFANQFNQVGMLL
jgi:hypothetical protein